MKRSVESQFGYCLLIWMFHSRKVNSEITHLQKRPLRIVYDKYITLFEDLLQKDSSLKFTIKTFKKRIANPILSESFPLRPIAYNLRSQTDSSVCFINTTHLTPPNILHIKYGKIDKPSAVCIGKKVN